MAEVVKQGDTEPIVWELDDANGLLPLDGAAITMEAYGPRETTAALKFATDCPAISKGRVRHTPTVLHFDTPGHFDVVFIVDRGGGQVRRVPSEGFRSLRVDPANP